MSWRQTMRWNIKHVRPICKWVSFLPTSVLLSHRGAFWRHDRDLHSEASLEVKGGLLAKLGSSWVRLLLVHVQGPSTDAITAPWIHGLRNRVAGDVVAEVVRLAKSIRVGGQVEGSSRTTSHARLCWCSQCGRDPSLESSSTLLRSCRSGPHSRSRMCTCVELDIAMVAAREEQEA